ncbi:MAG TPA: glycosyltransferase [Pyrinomonadaceae bacterium]|jgi:glycosyltransferase involved in cell wall biosynthesis
MSVSTLYLCYFGLREPLVQTQVLPYLRELVAGGVRVSLLTFETRPSESWKPEELEAERARLEAQGIRWHWRAYHKRPSLPATLYDVAAGARVASRLRARGEADVFHARGHVAALMAALAKRRRGGRMLFDIRGFMPEEYTDAGVWPAGGALYRGVKVVERSLMRSADAFVVLTERAREILFQGRDESDGRPVEVIPCCVDTERFRAADAVSRESVREELGIGADRRAFVYVGALGGWYLTEEMADLLARAHADDPRAFTLVITQSRPEMIAGPLRARGVRDEDFLVRRVAPSEVPRHLKAADVAVSFIKPCYSKLSSSPTKLAEYLAAGLPVVCNAGVGDVDAVVEGERVGCIVRELNAEAYGAALAEVESLAREPGLADRCRDAALRRFDLRTVGGPRYRRLYRRLLGAEPAEPPLARATARV